MNEFSDCKLFCFGLMNHGIYQRFVAESARPPKRVLDECRAESASERLSSARDDVAQFEIALKCRSLIQVPGRVNCPRLHRFGDRLSSGIERLITVFGSPLSYRVEVLKAKTNRINFAMATGALRRLLMSRQQCDPNSRDCA